MENQWKEMKFVHMLATWARILVIAIKNESKTTTEWKKRGARALDTLRAVVKHNLFYM